jgi:hypothetical protein
VGSTEDFLTTTCIFPDLARGAPFMIPSFLFGLSMRSSCQPPVGPVGILVRFSAVECAEALRGCYWIKMLGVCSGADRKP